MLGDYEDLGLDFNSADFCENFNDSSFFSEITNKSEEIITECENIQKENTHSAHSVSLTKKIRQSLPKIE